MHHEQNAKAAFTLVELMIVAALLGGVLGGLGLVLHTAGRSYRSSQAAMELNHHGGQALRRIVDALRSADTDSIQTVPAAPFWTSSIEYRANQGYHGQQSLWTPPRRFRLDPGTDTLTWTESAGLPEELQSGVCTGVPALLSGELMNGADDNGNGLIDEAGLCFVRSGDLVSVYLTVQRPGPDGEPLSRTWTASVLCRN